MIVLTACSNEHKPYLWQLRHMLKRMGVEHRVYVDEQRRGKPYCMNMLLNDLHKGEVIGFMDADDMPAEGWVTIEEKVRYEKNKIYYGDWQAVENARYYRMQKWDWDSYKRSNYIPFSGVVMRSDNLVEYPDIWHGNDWLFWWRLILNGHQPEYTGRLHAYRRTTTGYKRNNIPVYRKLKRLYYEKKIKKAIRNTIRSKA